MIVACKYCLSVMHYGITDMEIKKSYEQWDDTHVRLWHFIPVKGYCNLSIIIDTNLCHEDTCVVSIKL